MRYYVKTAAFAILIGGYTIYNLVIDSTSASNLSKGLFVAQPKISDMVLYRDIYRRNLNGEYIMEESIYSGEHVSRKLCKPPADPKYTAVFYAIAVLYLLIALAIVCDDFFCPSLDVLADWMNLSPDVAGATLMAAGSSAPELFTSAVGTFQRSDVGFGTVVGSAVFNVLFVVGICVLVTKIPLKITWWPLMRDSFFYLVTIVVLAIFFGVNSPNVIEFWESLILVLMYFL
jgi:small-conductance mechanosensitive channel